MPEPVDLSVPRYPVRLVASRTGLTPHLLRAWERRYSVVSPARTEGGQRLYSELDIERLRLLRRLTDEGHAIGRIASLPLADLARLDSVAQGATRRGAPAHLEGVEAGKTQPDRAESVGETIVAAWQATRQLDAVELRAVLERAGVTFGTPVFLDEVVAPFLLRVGHGWAEGRISVAQEHMATAIVRRVLGWLLQINERRGSAPRLVVATPPGQAHELGALMAAVSAAAEGWLVTYLGADVPVPDLVAAAAQTSARAVAISVVYSPEGSDLLATLRQLRAGLSESVPLLVGGAASVERAKEAEAAGARVIASLPQLRTALRQLAAEEAA